MTADFLENRHLRPASFNENRQLLFDRVTSKTLNTGEDFHSICVTGHSGMLRFT